MARRHKPLVLSETGTAGLHMKNVFFKLPLMGSIYNRCFSPGLAIANTKKFGLSFSMPSVLRIVIDNESQSPADVGRMVNSQFFKAENRVSFNVSFSCGKAGLTEPGKYTDPLSHWFNVFFGYYEIDVIDSSFDENGWERPFGYTGTSCREVEFYDLVRIAKSDWNYFSNFLYGVPYGKVHENDPIDMPSISKTVLGREQIGKHQWDYAEVDNLDVVSAYTSKTDEDKLENPSIFSPVWRVCFGKPHPRDDFNQSFISSNMKARFFMRSEAVVDPLTDNHVYKTYIFGGTINHSYDAIDKSFNDEFLEEQLNAARRTIMKYF